VLGQYLSRVVGRGLPPFVGRSRSALRCHRAHPRGQRPKPPQPSSASLNGPMSLRSPFRATPAFSRRRTATRLTPRLTAERRHVSRSGLTYDLYCRSFSFGHLRLAQSQVRTNGALDARSEVTRTGEVAGEKVVQPNVGACNSEVERAEATEDVCRSWGGTMSIQALVFLALPASDFLALLAVGMRVEPADLPYLLRRPSRLARSLLALNVLAPIVAIAVCKVFALHPAVIVALVTLSIAPVSNLFSQIGAGRIATSGPRDRPAAARAVRRLVAAVAH
jgi:hypothetical protein